MARAQRPDGYLNSWFQGQHPELVWKDLRWGHELYCAGHLLQAAVAGKRASTAWNLSGVADALVEQLLTTFSTDDGDGRLIGVCGHPEVETALVEFYRQTGDKRALHLAKRQIDLRGRSDVAMTSSGLLGNDRFPMSYFLHHLPVRGAEPPRQVMPCGSCTCNRALSTSPSKRATRSSCAHPKPSGRTCSPLRPI